MPKETNQVNVRIAETRKEEEGNKDRMGKKRCICEVEGLGEEWKRRKGLAWGEPRTEKHGKSKGNR